MGLPTKFPPSLNSTTGWRQACDTQAFGKNLKPNVTDTMEWGIQISVDSRMAGNQVIFQLKESWQVTAQRTL